MNDYDGNDYAFHNGKVTATFAQEYPILIDYEQGLAVSPGETLRDVIEEEDVVFYGGVGTSAEIRWELRAPRSGYLHAMNAQMIGETSMILGAGRAKKEDPIDHAAGIVLEKKTGDEVRQGETLAVFYTNRRASLEEAETRYLGALEWGEAPPAREKLILGEVGDP